MTDAICQSLTVQMLQTLQSVLPQGPSCFSQQEQRTEVERNSTKVVADQPAKPTVDQQNNTFHCR